jgi:hypothetical protein
VIRACVFLIDLEGDGMVSGFHVFGRHLPELLDVIQYIQKLLNETFQLLSRKFQISKLCYMANFINSDRHFVSLAIHCRRRDQESVWRTYHRRFTARQILVDLDADVVVVVDVDVIVNGY